MTRLKHILATAGLLFCCFAGVAQIVSNKGKEFWVGYGHHQFMENGTNTQNLVLYLSVENLPVGMSYATVKVTIDSSAAIPSLWWSRTYRISANTVIDIETANAFSFTPSAAQGGSIKGPMPKDKNGFDSRLYSDPPPFGAGGAGLFRKRGIHIQSDVPIVAYAHIYGSTSSGATMLLPTEAWGYEYVSLNPNQSYANDCYNWSYVVAKEDYTYVEITPTVKTRANNLTGLQPGQPTTVMLMKGQIYQVVGALDGSDANGNGGGSTGLNLSGTRFRAVTGPLSPTACKPIAVFSGSSRTSNPIGVCGPGGGDNDNQQMFPAHAWGKRYLTTPIAGTPTTSDGTTMYRVAVLDPSTVVKRNGSTLSGLNGNFYTFTSNTADLIEADKPITVVQLFSGGSCIPGSWGDPAMAVLSPVEQGTNYTGFYRNTKESIAVNYVNVVVPNRGTGLSSLRIDGSSSFTRTYPHPADPNYTVVIKDFRPASQGQCFIKSDSTFTAITYGLGSVEAYAYNAGTRLINLNAVSGINNYLDTSNGGNNQHAYTSVNTPFKMSVLLRYQATKIEWKFNELNPAPTSNLTPNPGVYVMDPASNFYQGLVTINGIQYHRYEMPGTFKFNQLGVYSIPIVAYNSGINNCGGFENLSISFDVYGSPTGGGTGGGPLPKRCSKDSIVLTGLTSATFASHTTGGNSLTLPIQQWSWVMPNNDTLKVKDTTVILPAGTHTIKFIGVAQNGLLVGPYNYQFDIVSPPTISLDATPDTMCLGQAVNFSQTTNYQGNSPLVQSWIWDIQDGAGIQTINNAASTSFSHTYAASGVYKTWMLAKVSNTCVSDTAFKTVVVNPKAIIGFTYPQNCLPSSGIADFSANATAQGGTPITSWNWNFGDPSSGSNTASGQNVSHTFSTSGQFQVQLSVVTSTGCAGDSTVTVNAYIKPNLTFGALSPVCRNTAPVSVANASANGASGTGYYYDSLGITTSAGMFDPANVAIGNHGIWYVFTTSQGCIDSIRQTLVVSSGANKPQVTTPIFYCQGTTVTTPLTATADAGNSLNWYDNPQLTNGSATAPTPSATTPGTYYYYVTQTPPGGCESDSAIITVIITPEVTNYNISADQTICSGTSANTLVSSGTVSGGNGTLNYQWQSSGDGTTWTDIAGITSETYNPGSITTTTHYRRVITSGVCSATSLAVTITVFTAISNNVISGNQNICEGSPAATITGTAGAPGNTFSWLSSTDNGATWTVIASATSQDYLPVGITATTQFKRVINNGPCTDTSNIVTITVNPYADGSISGPTSICENSSTGASITFVASTGTAPYSISYTVTDPANVSTTYTPSGLANNAVIPVIPVGSAAGNYVIKLNSITNSNGCEKTTGLNQITIQVTATPNVIISANPGTTICEGTNVTLTASGASTYLWNGGATTDAITVSPTTNTSYDVVGSSNGCSAAPKTITITVNPKPAKPAVTVPGPYCQNSASVALNATADAGNTLTWFNNNSLTGGSTTAPVPSTSAAGTFYFYVNQTTAANCTGDTSAIPVIVQPSIANYNISSDQQICSGSPASVINGVGSPAGGDGNYTYAWEGSTDGGTTWNPIPGVTSDNYNPGNVSVTTAFRRIVNSGQCTNTSLPITINVVPQITNYGISGNDTICAGQVPNQINGQTPPGPGNFAYTWESSTDNVTWSPISGANGINYQAAGPLNVTTYFRRKTENTPCAVTSSVVKITVEPLADGNISGPTSICEYDYAKVRFNATAGTATFTVFLTVKDPSGASTSQQASVANGDSILVIPVNSAPGAYNIRLDSIMNSNGCVTTTGLNSITIDVTATPVLSIALNPGNTICDGKSVTLTASGANAYSWTGSGLSTTSGNSVIATPTTPNTYTYSVTGTTNGCSSLKDTTITVNPTPGKPTVTTPVNYCQLGPTTALQATAATGNTLTWYDNQALTNGVTTPPVPSSTNAGTFYYYVTQTNSFGCESDTAVTTIIVAPGISGNNINGGETICQGSIPQTPLTNSGTLTGGNGTYTYQWQQSTDNGNTWTNIPGATSADYTITTPLNTTTEYRRAVTSALCGSISNVITETVFTGLANYDVTGTYPPVCENTTPGVLDGQTATGSGTLVYTWQSSTDGVNWTDIPSSNVEDYPSPALSVTTYYRRKVTNGPCTAFSSVIQIVVKPLANGTIAASNAAMCEYETADVTFTSTAGTGPFDLVLNITDPAGVSSTRSVPSANSGAIINVIPLNSAPGNYTIAFSSITSNGCTRTGLNSVTITVKPTPNVSINPVPAVCAGDSATLTAINATTYSWTPNTGLGSVTGNPVKAAPASTTTYTVVGTTNGCSAQDVVTVTVNPRPVVNINVADNEICITDVGVFTASSSITSGSVQTYYWDFDNGNTQVNPASISTTTPQTYSTHRTYITRLYAVSDQGCNSATDTAHIHVNPLPVAAFQTPSFVCLPNNVATFQNQSSIPNGASLNYAWNFGDAASGAANTSTAINGTHIYPDSANYTITLNVASAQGCTDQTTHTFNAFFRKPVAKFGVTPDTLCQGIQNLFMDSSFAPGSSIKNRLWLFGDGNSLLDSTNAAKIYTRPGDYRVALVVSNDQGCTSDTAYKNIKVYLQPVIDAGPSFVVGVGTTVTFNASANSSNVQFAWSSPSGAVLSDPSILKPQYAALQDAKFILTATGEGSCKAWDSISVKVLFPIVVPNAFSPNGDGINDTWDITNLKDYPNCVVEVYNRYGQIVFRSFGGYQTSWDGTHNGNPLPVGTYYYIIEPKNGFPKTTGFVVIVR